jgi:hypothetical protein
MLVKTYTGLDYSTINTRNVDSILVYLYHSGTACTVGGDTSLLEFISRNSDKSIYVASLKMTEERYSTANEILNTNVIPLYNISVESAYVKTLILNNLGIPPKEIIFFEEVTKNI